MTHSIFPDGFDDETLMAFADGLVTSERAQEIETVAAQDAGLRKRIDVFVETRQKLAKAFEAADPTPLPEGFEARIRAMAKPASAGMDDAGVVVNMAAVKAGRTPKLLRRGAPWLVVALAASLALVVGGLLGRMTVAPIDGGRLLPLAALAEPDVSRALSTAPTGSRIALSSGTQLQVVSTFLNEAGALCREFELDTAPGTATVAVACRAETMWNIEFAAALAAGDDGYAPASSMDVLDAWLSATGAGAPLDAAAEDAALKQIP